jgi:hypothetical protein
MSGTPRRYHLEAHLQSATYNILIATEEDVRQGDFVDYSDYASLSNAHDKLTADRDELLKALKLARANLQFLPPAYVVEKIDAAIAQAKEQP